LVLILIIRVPDIQASREATASREAINTSRGATASSRGAAGAAYRVRFTVVDDYGNRVGSARFFIFDTEARARNALSAVNNGRAVTGYRESLLSSRNGVVLSDLFYETNRQFFVIQAYGPESLKPNPELHSFTLDSNDNLLTERRQNPDGSTYYIKNIFPNNIVNTNMYKFRLIVTDSYNNTLPNHVFAIYSSQALARRDLLENRNYNNALEILDRTDSLGVAVSNKFHAPGDYYFVQVNSCSTLLRDIGRFNCICSRGNSQINRVTLEAGQRGESIERVSHAGNIHYIKNLSGDWLVCNNLYRIRIIDDFEGSKKIYGIFDNLNNDPIEEITICQGK